MLQPAGNTLPSASSWHKVKTSLFSNCSQCKRLQASGITTRLLFCRHHGWQQRLSTRAHRWDVERGRSRLYSPACLFSHALNGCWQLEGYEAFILELRSQVCSLPIPICNLPICRDCSSGLVDTGTWAISDHLPSPAITCHHLPCQLHSQHATAMCHSSSAPRTRIVTSSTTHCQDKRLD